jgi:hypothetical protein
MMPGRARLPGGEQRKASQRRVRQPSLSRTTIEPTWRPGDKVRWNGYTGTFLRDTVDGQAEVLIGTKTYLIGRGELALA